MAVKVLLITEIFPPQPGGSGRWLHELYTRLPDLDVHVAAPDFPGAAGFDASSKLRISRLALRLPGWGFRNVRSAAAYARAFLQLNRLTRRIRPDVLHCGKCLPEGLLALALSRWRRLPFCCYVHGEELTLARTSRELQQLTASVLRGAESLIANGEFTKALLADEWSVPPEKIIVLHPGVDTSRFVPVPPDPAIRARLGWTGRRVVLTIGALQKRKGQDTCIRALPSIRARCPDVLYAIAGAGWEREYLDALVAEHGVQDLVQFLGTPPDHELIELYQQCDLFALPNRRVGWDVEGFGIVLLEAQACGKPVIAGASGGTSQTLQPGRTGLVVDGESPQEVADAVGALLIDPARAERMGADARQWVVERFDWAVLSRQADAAFHRHGVSHPTSPPERATP